MRLQNFEATSEAPNRKTNRTNNQFRLGPKAVVAAATSLALFLLSFREGTHGRLSSSTERAITLANENRGLGVLPSPLLNLTKKLSLSGRATRSTITPTSSASRLPWLDSWSSESLALTLLGRDDHAP
jgi:hypothetical protein